MEHACANCGQNFDGVYCNQCGQKWNVPQFTFKHIFEEGFHAFTHADKSFLSFVKKLALDPGKLAYEYIAERRRKRYFNPFTFFLLISAANAFLTGLDLSLKEKLFHYNNEYGHLFNIYDKILSLAAIPFFAVATWLIHFKKPGLRYSEYTVFAMIVISVFSMVETVMHALDYSFTALLHSDVSVEDNLVYLLLITAYIAYADYRFHAKMNKSSWWKSLLVGVSFFLVLLAIQLFIVFVFINDFQGIGSFVMYGIKVN